MHNIYHKITSFYFSKKIQFTIIYYNNNNYLFAIKAQTECYL